MKTNSKTKIISKTLVLALLLAMIPFSTSCGVPGSLKKEAEENKNEYEGVFRNKVAKDLGPDYILHDVEGVISDSGFGSRTYIFSPDGSVSRGSRYDVSPSLKGKIDYNGETYDAEYYFKTDTMYTDAVYPEIIGDLAATMGLDKTKIIYGDLVASIDFEHVMMDSDIRTAGAFLRDFCGSNWYFVIVTTEDISNIEYYDYSPLLHELETDFLLVNIYSTDNMTDMEHFKENYGSIRWSTPQMFNKNKRLELSAAIEGETDVFTRYNFKNAARVEYYPYGMKVMSY